MRTETIVKTYAYFNELNLDQKSKVVESNRDININYEWWDCTREDFHAALKMLGFSDIESQFSGFSSQGDGASFSATFTYYESHKDLTERLDKFKESFPDFYEEFGPKGLIDEFIKLEDLDDSGTIGIIQRCRYCHECTMYCEDKKVQEFSRSLAAWYYLRLENEYEYLLSEEAISENLIDNEYEFDLDTLEIV